MGWRLGHSRIGFQCFMEDLNLPPFFVDRFQALGVTIQIAAHQIEYACAAILVFKNLAQ